MHITARPHQATSIYQIRLYGYTYYIILVSELILYKISKLINDRFKIKLTLFGYFVRIAKVATYLDKVTTCVLLSWETQLA